MNDVMRVLLVDGEPLALQRVASELRSFPDVDVVGVAKDGDTALDEARRLNPDLMILDVETPGCDGLSIAAALPREGGPDIVFLSTVDRYAASAFEVEALDYLLKPLQRGRLRQTIERARRRRAEKAAHMATRADEAGSDTPASIHIPGRLGGHDVPLSEIVWIEAARDYAVIHTDARIHILRATMNELAKRLPEAIMRVHRSAFVTLAHVRRWRSPAKGTIGLVLSDGSEVSIGPSYVRDVINTLRSLNRSNELLF